MQMRARFLTTILFPAILVCGWLSPAVAQELKQDDLFPHDRVLNVQITVDEEDWDTIRVQTRNIRKELGAARKLAPIEGPYSWVNAKVSIDGVDLGEVGLRKKGFLGSQSSVRPSLKIKLNHIDKQAHIDGLSSLTFNNNRQDLTVMYQFLGYSFFEAAGAPASRCAFAKVTVNGENLGVYSHVESARKPLVKRCFGDDSGPLYEGTVVDFYDGWTGSFENKFGDDETGRKKIEALIEAMKEQEGEVVFGGNAEGKAWVPVREEYSDDWTALDFDDSAWKSGHNGAGYETQTGYESELSSAFDFQKELFDESTSLCLRFPFEVTDPGLLESGGLFLRVKYDDGFVAFLNGKRIASSNAPNQLRWNSRATSSHPDNAALQFEWFEITAFQQELREGKNVLAIQALNSDARSTDMLCVAEIQRNDHDFVQAIAEHVDLDAFYRFWAIEGLIGFWDGYTANRNNFFFYLNPETDKFHFMPWGVDAIFVKYGFLERDESAPLCVKTSGRIAHKLYQSAYGRKRYEQEMRYLLEHHWDADHILKEIDRVEALIKPHLCKIQSKSINLKGMRKFVENRRADVEKELNAGLPPWSKTSGEPPIIPARPDPKADTIWNAARDGDVKAIELLIAKGKDVNAIDDNDRTPLSIASLLGRTEAAKRLVESGADVRLRARGNQTVLHLAAFLGHSGIVRFLLEQDADINATNANAQTPLDICTTAWKEVEPVIDFLDDQFDVELDREKVQKGREEVAEFLRSKDAKTAEQLRQKN